MDFEFVVNAHVERSEGKFASREEIEEQLLEAIQSADPGSVEGEAGGQYDVTDWNAEVRDLKVIKGKAREVVASPPKPIEPAAPRVHRIIKAYVRLKAQPETLEAVQDLEDALEELVTSFPKSTQAANAALVQEAVLAEPAK